MTPEVAAEECSALNRPPVFEVFPGRETLLGPLPIRRALPVHGRRLIGPWCFLDRYGPLSFTDAKPMDVAPHPHIGLQTVSWLLDGEVVHHDSLGFEGVARPGAVNVMTAGSGIAHSEETPRKNSGRLSGVQLWIALPDAHRDTAPSFQAIDQVPVIEFRGGEAQLFAGTLEGVSSPAQAYSDLIGADASVHQQGTLVMPAGSAREHGVFLLEGEASFEGQPLLPGAMHYLGCGRSELSFQSSTGARLLILGGTPFAEPILMWWNFVARTPEEIASARRAWESGQRFGEVEAYRGARLAAPPLSRIARPNPAS